MFAHGLVNGTTGLFEDIIVDADGVPTALFGRVKRRKIIVMMSEVDSASLRALRIRKKLLLPFTGGRTM